MKGRHYYDWAVIPLALLLVALGIVAFASLGLAVTGWQRVTNGTLTPPLGAVYTTWFIPVLFDDIVMNPGDHVPFVVEQASQGIVRTDDYAFVLPVSGVYWCTTQAYSKFQSYFFDLVLNPDTAGATVLPGGEFNSNAQWTEAGLTPISVLFNATAGDRLVLLYNNSFGSSGQQMRLGRGDGEYSNAFQQRPFAYIHIRRIA